MPSIPHKLRELLDATREWCGCDKLTFKPHWLPLEKSTLKSLTPVAGVYAIGLTQALRYEAANSFVLYVGSSKDLKKRLTSRFSTPQNEIIKLCSAESEKRFQNPIFCKCDQRASIVMACFVVGWPRFLD